MASNLTNKFLAKIYTRFPALGARWGKSLASDDSVIPWIRPTKPLAKATVALVTTGGVHRDDQVPFDMSDPEGDATYREFSADTDINRLVITHDYFDSGSAERDMDLVLPVASVRELVGKGMVGALYETVFSFMGHVDGEHVAVLRDESAKQVAAKLAGAEVDYALLVPA